MNDNTAKRTAIFVVSEDYYFLSHRLPMARAVRDLGFRVIVACRIDDGGETIRAEGFDAVHVPFNRGGLNPLGELGIVRRLRRLFREELPALVVNVSMKPIIDGSIAAGRVPGCTVINLFTGLGALFSTGRAPGWLRFLATATLRTVTRPSRFTAVVQNRDDADRLAALGLSQGRAVPVIAGSGVDLAAFAASDEPEEGPVVALMVSRLLWDKGVGELVEAARLLKDRGADVAVRIAGAPDDANPGAVSRADIARFEKQGNVTFLGHQSDIAALWRDAHVAVFPSYYPEGVPKCLLEAAASARPIVTTDMPGCRALVPDGETGILVAPRDPAALADAIEALAGDARKRRAMGRAARWLAEERFAETAVMKAFTGLVSEKVPPAP